MNHNLKNALSDAGLTVEDFASILSVDPKSVGRWIAGTSTPYPRHRAAISRALALDEAILWPERAIPTVEIDGAPNLPTATTPSTGVRAWAEHDHPSAPDLVELLTATDGPLDILDTDIAFDLARPVSTALVNQAAAGRPVRVATVAPRPNLAPLVQHAGIELRFVEAGGVALIRAGTTTLIFSTLGGPGDGPAVALLAEAGQPDGLHQRFADLFDTIWNGSTETIATLDELEAYRTNAYDDLEGELDDDIDTDDEPEPERPAADRPIADANANTAPVADAPPAPPNASPARRWPGSRTNPKPD